MILQLYSVYDVKACSYGNPMVMRSDGEATRAFAREVNDPRTDNLINSNPADFSLYRIAEWYPDEGAVVANGANIPLLVTTALSVLNPPLAPALPVLNPPL